MLSATKRTIIITSPQAIDQQEMHKLHRSLEKKYEDSNIDFKEVVDPRAIGIEITIQEPEIDPTKRLVSFTSAVPLSKSQLERLKTGVSKKYTDRELVFRELVDPRVIGGVKVTIDSYEYDSTVQGKLDRLYRHLRENF